MSISVYDKVCSFNFPGNLNLFLTEVLNITNVTIVAGVITDLTLAAGTAFNQVQARLDTITRNEVADPDKINAYDHMLSFTLDILSTRVNDFTSQIKDASPCGMAAIVIDNNQKPWLVGWNYIEAYKRALYLKNYSYLNEKLDETGSHVDFDLSSRSECMDLAFDSTLTDYILAYKDADQLEFNLEDEGMEGMDGFVMTGMDGSELTGVEE